MVDSYEILKNNEYDCKGDREWDPAYKPSKGIRKQVG